jgi:hypothetical protein
VTGPVFLLQIFCAIIRQDFASIKTARAICNFSHSGFPARVVADEAARLPRSCGCVFRKDWTMDLEILALTSYAGSPAEEPAVQPEAPAADGSTAEIPQVSAGASEVTAGAAVQPYSDSPLPPALPTSGHMLFLASDFQSPPDAGPQAFGAHTYWRGQAATPLGNSADALRALRRADWNLIDAEADLVAAQAAKPGDPALAKLRQNVDACKAGYRVALIAAADQCEKALEEEKASTAESLQVSVNDQSVFQDINVRELQDRFDLAVHARDNNLGSVLPAAAPAHAQSATQVYAGRAALIGVSDVRGEPGTPLGRSAAANEVVSNAWHTYDATLLAEQNEIEGNIFHTTSDLVKLRSDLERSKAELVAAAEANVRECTIAYEEAVEAATRRGLAVDKDVQVQESINRLEDAIVDRRFAGERIHRAQENYYDDRIKGLLGQ